MSKQMGASRKTDCNMPTSAVDRLVALGLSEYEATVYLVLLEENPSTAAQVAACSGVPLTSVCGVLDSLERRGAVVSANGNGPRMYATIPAEEFLDRLRNDFRNLILRLKDSL